MPNTQKKSVLLSVKDVCAMLGISRQTIYLLRQDKKINSRLIGKNQVRFTEEDVANYINNASRLPA